MKPFFPALQNRLLTKLLAVCVLLLLVSLAAMVSVRELRDEPEARPEAEPAPLFITGGTQAPVAE
ncbi:MAG: hypothetical protein AAFZ87_00950 [Planctomycetota bacterium]